MFIYTNNDDQHHHYLVYRRHHNQQDLANSNNTNNKKKKVTKIKVIKCVGIEGNLLTCTQNNFVVLLIFVADFFVKIVVNSLAKKKKLKQNL